MSVPVYGDDTHTPLHSTKLPLSVWLKGMWLILQSDKGLSSVRLAEALGVSQPTAWRMGHALRLMAARERMLDGTVEIDHFHLGGRPRINLNDPPPGRGRKGLPNTQKTPVMVIVQRPDDVTPGTPAGDARAAVVTGLSARAAARAAEAQIDPDAYLMSDEATAFIALGENYARHDTVKHSSREYVRDAVFPRPSHNCRRLPSYQPAACRLYFHEIGFRWSHALLRARQCGKAEMAHENPVVAGAAGAAIAASLSRRYRPPNAQKSGRWIIVKSAVAVLG